MHIDAGWICHSCDWSSRLRACLHCRLNSGFHPHFSTNLSVSRALKLFTWAYLSSGQMSAGPARLHRLKPSCSWKAVSECLIWQFHSGTGNGCNDWERMKDIGISASRMKNATGRASRPHTRWIWDQVVLFLSQRRSWCHCCRCPPWRL